MQKRNGLYRLIKFVMDSIDISNLTHVILFQSVGPLTTFYMSSLIGGGVYYRNNATNLKNSV